MTYIIGHLIDHLQFTVTLLPRHGHIVCVKGIVACCRDICMCVLEKELRIDKI